MVCDSYRETSLKTCGHAAHLGPGSFVLQLLLAAESPWLTIVVAATLRHELQ